MKISEFSIMRYGPLPGTGRVSLGGFSLLFGKNEDGKTLTIDALVKLLLKHGRTLFERIKRVDEEPEGYIVIEDDKGNQIKLPEKADVMSITNLTPQECRNIFIIRNSDLSIATETEFYRDVTDRLTGLRSAEMLSIRNELQEIGKLTRPDSAGSLRDRTGEKLKSRVRRAEALIESIEGLMKNVASEGLDELEEELVRVREKASEVSHQLEYLEEARKREQYEKGNMAYQSLVSAQEQLKKLDAYTDEDAEAWMGCERDIARDTKDAERLERDTDKQRTDYERAKKQLDEENIAFESVNNRKKRIDDEIKPEIKNYEMKSGEVKLKEAKRGFSRVATIISAILLAISAVGIIVNPSPGLYALFGLSLTSTVVFVAIQFSLIKEKAWLAGVFERIRLAAAAFGIRGETIKDLVSAVQQFDEEHAKKHQELEQTRTKVSLLESEIKRLTEVDIVGIESKLTEARNKEEGIAQKSGARTLQEYRERLALKSTHEQSAKTQIEILKSHFGSRGKGLEEDLPYWLEEIQALAEFQNKVRDVAYDGKCADKLKAELRELERKEQQLQGKMTSYHEQLKEIERQTNNDVLQLEGDYLHCDNHVDMVAIRDRLSEFATEVEENKDVALSAIGILENLERQEEEKISSLFGRDSPISKYFREITGGLYEEVEFIVGDIKKVQVRLKDGSTLDAASLSGGAYDQLYLSIRLALGEKLLKGGKGFFIMDDPFVKADKERLQRQIDILRGVSELGWQVLYFTAKDEVVDALKSDIEKGKVSYIELRGIFA